MSKNIESLIGNGGMSRVQLAMSPQQWMTTLNLARNSEEGDFFVKTLEDLSGTLSSMPEIYQQDGEPTAYLHYFHGNSHWFIMEIGQPREGEYPSFGYAVLNGDTTFAESGYIDINELRQVGAEIDFHFEPTSLDDVVKQMELRYDPPTTPSPFDR